MKLAIASILLVVFFASCGVKISSSEKRAKWKIKGGDPDVAVFKNVLLRGKIVNEETYENYRFIMVEQVPGNKPFLFVEEFFPKKSLRINAYKRRIQVYLISDASRSVLTINTSRIKRLGSLPISKISDFVNGSSVKKDFNLYEAYARDNNKNNTIHRGLYIKKNADSLSGFEVIDNALTAKDGYQNRWVTFDPPGYTILRQVNKGKLVWIADAGMADADDKKTGDDTSTKKPDKEADPIKGYQFSHSCSQYFNFLVTVVPQKEGGLISIHNNFDSATVRNPGRIIDSVYTYSSRFDDINYFTWLKNIYSKLGDDCAKYLAYRITEEIYLHDTALLAYKYAKPEKKEEKKPSLAVVKRGSITIDNTPPTVMEPLYSGKGERNNTLIPIQFKVNAPYDALANQVPLAIDTVLSNRIKLLDTTITISKNEWNAALASDGIIKKQVKVSYVLLKDSIKYVQTSYLIIKDQSDQGQHEIQLTPSLYNPNKPFWVEIGSNFDLVDGLEPNNFFTGVFFHKRDIRSFSRDSKQKNLGLFAGVYESKSVSVAGESDTIRNYYNSNSLALVNNGNVGIFKDSGTVKTLQVVRNVSLFFSPQLRLSNGSANENGMHFFVSAWAELQWQRITYQTDYSKQVRVDTMYRPVNSLSSFNETGTREKNIDIKSHYFGFGIPVYFKEDDVNVYFNPVFGISSQPRGDSLEIVFAKRVVDVKYLKRTWSPFYVFQFRLNEEKYGIAFTGEVRGLIRRNSPPFVSLALTKKFDLSKFIEFQK